MPTMPNTRASDASPAAIARAALRRLAEQGIEPTPEAYRRAYLEAAPPGSRPPGAPPAAAGGVDQAAVHAGSALAAFVREWERSQAGVSRLQKLQALRAIADHALPEPALRAMQSATERWAGLRERPLPVAVEAAAAAQPQGAPWKRLWQDAVRMAEQAYVGQPELQGQAQALLEEAGALDSFGAAFAGRAQALWDACERWHVDSARARERLPELLRLLLDNVAQLFAPQHWMQERVAGLRQLLVEPLEPERLEQAVHQWKDLLLRQGVAQKAGDDARVLARELIDMVVRSLGGYVQSTERYGDRLRSGLRELDESGDWQRAKSVVQGILAQSQQMLEETGRLRSAFADARQQLQLARDRAQSLESALDQMGELIQQDPLTGALNRRGLELSFAREAARAHRQGVPLGLAMVDLDFFKAINDRYGHDIGDVVLRELVQVLRSELRPTDIVARIGGEEFLLLLPGEDEQGVHAALQRARQVFGARRFHHAREPAGIAARFSAGAGCWCPGESLDEAYARIDQALLQAKAGGRDRVENAASPPPRPGLAAAPPPIPGSPLSPPA